MNGQHRGVHRDRAALGVAAFTVSTGLMLTVVGGYRMFAGRESAPPAPYLEPFGADTDYAAAMLPSWTFLAVGAQTR